MKLFYYIAVHKNPEQVAELVNAVKRDESVISIHVDAKSDISTFKKIIPENEKVFFVKDRINVFWAGFSQVESVLTGMKLFSGSGCDFFVFLSGQDFPIRPITEFENYLAKHRTNNFILLRRAEEEWKGALERIKIKRNVDLFNKWRYKYKSLSLFINKAEGLSIKLNSISGKRNLPYGYKLFGGSQWFVFNAEMVNSVLQTLKSKPRLKEFFRHTVCPDEHFFHTIIGNSDGKHSVIQNNLRYIRFIPGKDNPEVLTLNDLEAMCMSGAFFARKFDLETQPDILDELERLIRE